MFVGSNLAPSLVWKSTKTVLIEPTTYMVNCVTLVVGWKNIFSLNRLKMFCPLRYLPQNYAHCFYPPPSVILAQTPLAKSTFLWPVWLQIDFCLKTYFCQKILIFLFLLGFRSLTSCCHKFFRVEKQLSSAINHSDWCKLVMWLEKSNRTALFLSWVVTLFWNSFMASRSNHINENFDTLFHVL